MSNQDQTPKTETEAAAEVTDTDLEKVVGGLVIEGIKGESQDDKHKDEIQLGSF
jgi:hypothetical protein